MSDRFHGAIAAHAKYGSTGSVTDTPTSPLQHVDGNHQVKNDQNPSSDRGHPNSLFSISETSMAESHMEKIATNCNVYTLVMKNSVLHCVLMRLVVMFVMVNL